MSGPLSGFRVLEMASVISGPYAGMLLADLGAEVTKVELPGTGDVFRLWDGQSGRVRPQFAAQNRGKRSVTIDARRPEGQQVFLRLAAASDVVLENFRPGTLDRMGIGYEAVAGVNPDVVYCSISGMGPTGPYRDRPTYDAIALGFSGLWSQFADAARPQPVGLGLCDQLTGLYAAHGILAALVGRAAGTGGQKLEVSMLGAALAVQTLPVADYTLDGNDDRWSRPRRSQVYAAVAADGLPLAIHLSTPRKFWLGLCAALGRPELASDPRFADKSGRIRNYEELRDILAAAFATRPRAQWLAELERHDVPAAPINSVGEALADPQVQATEMVRRFGSGERAYDLVGFPVRFSRTPCEPSLPPPDLGEHTDDALRAAGLTPDEIERLRADGVI